MAVPLSESQDLPSEAGALARSLFRPVREGNPFEVTVERLATAIRLGAVTDRLPPERELSGLLGVSRMTLREALRALGDAGFVTVRRGRGGGTFVKYRPAEGADAVALARSMGESLTQALDFRRIVEPGAAALAATRTLPASRRDYLITCLRECTAATEDGARRLADARLHLALAGATECPPLILSVADVRGRLSPLLEAIPVLQHNVVNADEQHATVVGAVLDGEAEQARSVMQEHCDATAALLRGFLS
jgi:GntR family transcriptional repressor for pyruvate dehydrogenase complex